MRMYKFRVPLLPISVNSMYKYNFGNKTKYLSEEARHFKFALKLACPPMSFSTPNPRLFVMIEYHSPTWICKNGNVRKKDGMNMDKLVFDSVAEKIGIDDSRIFKWSGIKVLSEEEFTEITVEEII